MKTFRYFKRKQDVWRERVARMNAGRERKRMERAATELPRVEWRGRLEYTITFHNRLTGEVHALDLRRGRRRDQFDAEVDGKSWKRGLNATKLATLIRRKLAPHVCD